MQEEDLDTHFPLKSITRIQCSTGLAWADIEICCHAESLRLAGISNNSARRLAQTLQERVAETLLSLLEPHRASLSNLWHAYTELLKAPHYLAHSDLEEWRRINQALHRTSLPAITDLVEHPLLPCHPFPDDLVDQARTVMAAMSGKSKVLEKRNEHYLQQEMIRYQDFFDSVESTPLTAEQRRACVVMEDRNLLVASAGSGKTSTVVGKTGYALLRELVTPREILVVAFNAHAAKELEERVHERLQPWIPEPLSIKVKTFHALGLEIIATVEGARPAIAADGDGDGVTGEVITDLLATDAEFAAAWVRFHALYRDNAIDPEVFETAQDWRRYVKDHGEYENGLHGFRTLYGDLAGSPTECAIANWLYLNGVEYVHAHSLESLPCHPGIYLPAVDTYIVCQIPGVAGKPAIWHRVRRAWVRAKSRKRPRAIETSFPEYLSGVLFSKLEKELVNRGISFTPLPVEQALDRIGEVEERRREVTSQLLQTFVKHARARQMTPTALEAAATSHSQPARACLFSRIAGRVMDRYASRLRASGTVDFGDMILKAARYAHDGRYRHPFRLILVDEFQDISRDRAALLLGLLKHAPDAKLFAVGDDWQSIYRFAGSDISLFTGFEAHFGKTAVHYLTRTFRSNQGIAETAARFVQRNNAQMRKQVVAADQTSQDTLVVRRHKRRNHLARYVEACLEEMAQEVVDVGEQRMVFILGRYRRQAPASLTNWKPRYQPALQIEFMTMHSSKGLQADYVIVIGLQAQEFPSERVDDPLLHLVMPEPEAYPHAEERRLFYVALTRARHRVYVLGSKGSPSCFVTELVHGDGGCALRIADELKGDGICPQCGLGTLTPRNGAHGPFFGCSEFPVCRYTRGRL